MPIPSRRLVAPTIIIIGVLSILGCEETDRKTLLFNGGVGPSLLPGADPFFRDNDGPFFDSDEGPFFRDDDRSRRPHFPLFVSRGVQVGPTFIDAQRVNNVVCPGNTAAFPVSGALVPNNPAFSPVSGAFVAPVNVVVTGNGRSDLFLSDVGAQFTDRTGVLTGGMVIPQPDLTNRFGSTIIPTFGTRTFGFEFPLGCTTAPTGTLTVVVFIGDSFGRDSRSIRNLTIR